MESGLMRGLKRLPTEWYVLGILLMMLGLFYVAHSGVVDDSIFHGISYYAFFGLRFVAYAIVVILLLAYVQIFTYFFRCVQKVIRREPVNIDWQPLKDGVSLFIYFALFSAGVVLVLDQIFRLPPERIAAASNLINELDMRVFGSYLPFELQRMQISEAAGRIYIIAYLHLITVLSVAFLVLFVKRIDLLRKYMLAFFLIIFVSAPVWFSFPAVSPHEMFVRNVTGSEISPDMAELASVVSPTAATFLQELEPIKSLPNDGIYANTAFPSMHVGLSAIAMYYLAIYWWPVLFILVPWMLLNMLGAVYSMQHYAIDMPAGLVAATVSILLVELIFKFDTRKQNDIYDPYVVMLPIRKRLESFARYCWSVRNICK